MSAQGRDAASVRGCGETPTPAFYEERIRHLEAERQQAIDALREIALSDFDSWQCALATAALVKLGEKP